MFGGGFFIVLHLLEPRFLRYHTKTFPYNKQEAVLPTLFPILKCITIYKMMMDYKSRFNLIS